jgi:hypothetical protein
VDGLQASIVAVCLHLGRHLAEIPATLPRVPRHPRERARRTQRKRAQSAPREHADAGQQPRPGSERTADSAAQALGEQQSTSPPADLPEAFWQQLDHVDLAAECRRPTQTLQEPPRFFRGRLRWAFSVALREMKKAYRARNEADAERKCRAWKLFLLIPRMLL